MRHDPTDLKTQEEARKASELQARLDREAEEGDCRWLMSSKRGRRIVWRLLEQAGVFRSSFSTTAMQMAFNEGYRNYGNHTLGLLHQYCKELYPQRIKDNTHDRTGSPNSK